MQQRYLFCWSLFLYCYYLPAQPAAWTQNPQEDWPPIAMINEVWYENGERYIHPSFEYAATGFLIDAGRDTLAATVKHALWIARPQDLQFVDINDRLERWIMRPKGNHRDSVVIDRLINTDRTEILQGAGSSITQRDWLVFSVQSASTAIQPLRPRYTPLQPGEKIWYLGCPYDDPVCSVQATEVIEVEGNRIVFRKPEGIALGGASGSPLVDADGFLVGIMGGSAVARSNGENALYGTSTAYLQKVLSHQPDFNRALTQLTEVLLPEFKTKGIRAGIKVFQALKADPDRYFQYDLSLEALNAVGDELLEASRIRAAIAVYKLNLEELNWSPTYTKLAAAYLAKGNTRLAEKTLLRALELWPENEEAAAALGALKEAR